MDFREHHRNALEVAGDVVERVRDSDLQRATPCADWTLAELLAHMIGQHGGFAAAVRDGDAPRSSYAPVSFSPERWQASVSALLDAFAEADPDATAVAVELAPTPLPVGRLIAAQFLDTVVHTWDVARSLGRAYEPAPDVAELVAGIARGIPDDARRTATDAAFAPALREDGSVWERALARLGRDPAWQPT